MQRTFLGSAILVLSFALSPVLLRADPVMPVPSVAPAAPVAPAMSGTGQLVKSGTATILCINSPSGEFNTYSGGTVVSGGVLNIAGGNGGASNNATTTLSGLVVNGDDSVSLSTANLTIGYVTNRSPATAPQGMAMPIPNGPVFYIITEGAGMGDSVRTAPCTGKETVLAAIAAVNGISQVSNSAKIWIARPSPNKGGKSTILPVDWPAISKRGDNATNYAILPGDRLVFGEDALTTQSNLLGKKVVPLQRIAEIIAFMTSAMSEVQNTPGAAKLATQLVQGNLITDDARLNALFLDALHSAAEKPAGKAAAKPAPDQGTTSTDHVDNVVAIDDTEVAKSAAKTTVIVATRNALVLSGSTALEDEPKAVVPVASAPHELALQSLPAYRIEPPDMIQIDSSKPIAGNQPVNGQYLVGPDGTINLRKFGQVNISGKTVAEAKAAIEKQLRVFLNAPEVSVSVIAYNSKVYYIVTQGAGLGDSVRRLPITGNETVLDAIAQIKGLSQVSSTNISIVRPSAANPQEATVLSVDWGGVSRRGETATNYQIFPGDRIVVGQDSTVTASNMLAKKTASIERAAGIIGVTANTVQSLNDAHGSGKAVQELLRKGLFDSDPDLKKCVEVLIRITEETKGPKAAPSPTGR